ncbi:uncharacterized protein [Elaeis guineensis]|uniref:Uncharacterized protein LOC105051106 n=1 Tax=Elaeis guineensis var. tenera TaxID=51953 RepID=A0A6I9RPC7_ELAGV|nr:uncharacterized protein LOC105051106 [Elaeis guineensis]
MALQAPAALRSTTTTPRRIIPSLLSPPPNHTGLRAPSDRHALRSAFSSPSVQLLLSPLGQAPATAPRFSMRVASKQAYICRDCGYIYNDRTPFEKLSDKYFCPVCGAPKRRFRPYEPAVTKNANATDVRKARKAQMKRDENIGKALPVAIVLGVAGLAGLYFYLNNAY